MPNGKKSHYTALLVGVTLGVFATAAVVIAVAIAWS